MCTLKLEKSCASARPFLGTLKSSRLDCSIVISLYAKFHECLSVHFRSLYPLRVRTTPNLLLLFSSSVMSNSLQLHGLQHARPPCPSPTPGVYLNSCPLIQRRHTTISFSVVAFSSHLQSSPASGSFQMSQFFTSGGQSTGVSASVIPVNIQD